MPDHDDDDHNHGPTVDHHIVDDIDDHVDNGPLTRIEDEELLYEVAHASDVGIGPATVSSHHYPVRPSKHPSDGRVSFERPRREAGRECLVARRLLGRFVGPPILSGEASISLENGGVPGDRSCDVYDLSHGW